MDVAVEVRKLLRFQLIRMKFVPWIKQLVNFDAIGPGDPFERGEANVFAAVLQLAHVATVHPHSGREVILVETETGSQGPDALSHLKEGGRNVICRGWPSGHDPTLNIPLSECDLSMIDSMKLVYL